jgi:probable rRNA maturation factor
MPVEIVDQTGAPPPKAKPEGLALRKPQPEGLASGKPQPEGLALRRPQPEGLAPGSPQGADLVSAARHAADAILACLAREDAELCVVLVDDVRMRQLNRDWRGKDAATDVLSFSQLEGEAMPLACLMLGDVVVSVDALRRQAADGGWAIEEELARLLLHGVLHLLGFDHEHEDDARAMRAEEGRLVGLLADRGVACAWEGE